jgi:hypothetical protein
VAALPVVDLGPHQVRAIDGGYAQMCALLDGGSLRCSGWDDHGRLGLGDTEARGDNPGEMGDPLPAVHLP